MLNNAEAGFRQIHGVYEPLSYLVTPVLITTMMTEPTMQMPVARGNNTLKTESIVY